MVLALLAVCTVPLGTRVQADSILNSAHDLSARGPGPVRALSEQEVCIFCHTPHNAQPEAALWNRDFSRTHYRIYDSSTVDARIGQPSGPSKMCLSCHDGSIALGNLLSRPDIDAVTMTSRTIPGGPADLGNDLSDDHPIGFRYDRALGSIDPQLRTPELISRELPLGEHGEFHCTTCHDPHDNELGDFLRITDRGGAMCVTCHDMAGWRLASHALSHAKTPGRLVDPTDPLKYATVAENACLNCHKIHSAPQRERLLRSRTEEGNCLNCHNGSVAKTNILGEIRKLSGHRGMNTRGVHDPREQPQTMQRHVECVDCHNPHAARGGLLKVTSNPSTPPPVPPESVRVSGLTASGAPTDRAYYTYQICFKCHGDNINRPASTISRQITQTNTRLEFQPNNPSFHPILRPRNSPDVPSLLSPMTPSTMISCTDCHNSDQSRLAGGSGPDGPHGSRFEPLLIANYSTKDFTSESEQSYALCYRCHDRSSILGNESFTLHRLHVVGERAPCSVCHDAHGISATQGNATDHSNLINFDLSVVRPIPFDFTPRLGYVDTGRMSGSCTLVCHDVTHVNFAYP